MAAVRKLPARAWVVPMGRAYVVKAEYHAKLGWAARIQTWTIHHYGSRTAHGKRTRWRLESDRYVKEAANGREWALVPALRRMTKEAALVLGEEYVVSLLKNYPPEKVIRGCDVPEFDR